MNKKQIVERTEKPKPHPDEDGWGAFFYFLFATLVTLHIAIPLIIYGFNKLNNDGLLPDYWFLYLLLTALIIYVIYKK